MKFGMRELVMYGSIIIIFIIVIVFLVIRNKDLFDKFFEAMQQNNQNSSSSEEPKTYTEMEIEIKNGVLEYINNNDFNVTGERKVISVETLDSYIYTLRDLEDKSLCNGYALVWKNGNGDTAIEPYLKCSNYQTGGYQEWRLD